MPVSDYEFISRLEMKVKIRELSERIKHLEDLIRKVVTQEDDDICWRDIYTELAKEVGLDFTPKLMDKPEKMLANCRRFISSIYYGPYIPVYCRMKDD